MTDDDIATSDSEGSSTDGDLGLAVRPGDAHERVDRRAARLERKREKVAAIEGREPLRRRVLQALAEEPSTSKALALKLEVAPESVSRQLTALSADALVRASAVEGDSRLRLYALTGEGEVQLSQHRAFGAPEEASPEPPTDEETIEFLRSALRNAVRMRRRTNRLEDAAARLRIVLNEAQRLGEHALALEVMSELATTLRQNRSAAEVEDLLGTLQQISLGRHPSRDAALALPAAAHHEYALGRLPEAHGGVDSRTRARHLDTAQTLYGQLARSSTPAQRPGWRQREAWSIVSFASNLRERSKLEDALERTAVAMSMFRELEDVYGESRCLFLFGFCLRLMGDFEGAWRHLACAYDLASNNAFERFQADSLMQMGEVRRCQGEVAEASELLDEALRRADRMGLVVTQAFAQSALGAVEYQSERFQEARLALRRAHELFAACEHREGLALNTRREAIVARRLAGSSRSRQQFNEARWYARSALERYQLLRSPAGIAACEIERTRLLLMCNDDATDAIARLAARLDDTPQRNLLELDPWVPTVVEAFAEEVGDVPLRERASQLVKAAERRLEDLTKQGSRRVAVTARAVRRQLDERRGKGFEMGGEARRERDAIGPLNQVA